jgi:hypothetical protein
MATAIKIPDLDQAIDMAMQGHHDKFPFQVFPDPIQKLIRNANKTVGFNPDYFSAGILSVSATAIGNTISIENGTYPDKPILWISIIGRPGTGKTHPLRFAKHPIELRDSLSFNEFESLLAEYNKQDRENRGSKPRYKKFILNDFTPEKLAESLQFNEKGVIIFQDELMRWINSFDQYKKGGDQQMYLGLFNGGELTVDRITKDPIRVERTNVNILGGMQPDILKGMAKDNRDKDGFLERFLFVYPDNLEPVLFTGQSIEQTHRDNYERMIGNLLDAPEKTIRADAETIEIFMQWQHRTARASFNDHLEQSIQSKLETYVWRLALTLEMMDQASRGSYSTRLKEKSLRDAITLAEYFRYNALKVHDRILAKTPLEDLTALQKDVYDSLPDEFQRMDVLPLFKSKNMSESTGDRLLKNGQLFYNYKTHKDLKSGQYKKKII